MNITRKILVIDDDPVIGQTFTRVLSNKGYAVITAQNGGEALSKLAGEEYDAIFTDIKMPGMSGIEVAKQIKATKPWLPVVIVSGYGSDANRADAAEAGVTEFMQKPLSPELILDSAEKATHESAAWAMSQPIDALALTRVVLACLRAHPRGVSVEDVAEEIMRQNGLPSEEASQTRLLGRVRRRLAGLGARGFVVVQTDELWCIPQA